MIRTRRGQAAPGQLPLLVVKREKGAKRARPVQHEKLLHKSIIAAVREREGQSEAWRRIYHVPNGEVRGGYKNASGAVIGVELDRLGVRPGVFDLGLELGRWTPYRDGWFPRAGLRVEVKHHDGDLARLTADRREKLLSLPQRDWLRWYCAHGLVCFVVCSVEEALTLFGWWIDSLPPYDWGHAVSIVPPHRPEWPAVLRLCHVFPDVPAPPKPEKAPRPKPTKKRGETEGGTC